MSSRQRRPLHFPLPPLHRSRSQNASKLQTTLPLFSITDNNNSSSSSPICLRLLSSRHRLRHLTEAALAASPLPPPPAASAATAAVPSINSFCGRLKVQLHLRLCLTRRRPRLPPRTPTLRRPRLTRRRRRRLCTPPGPTRLSAADRVSCSSRARQRSAAAAADQKQSQPPVSRVRLLKKNTFGGALTNQQKFLLTPPSLLHYHFAVEVSSLLFTLRFRYLLLSIVSTSRTYVALACPLINIASTKFLIIFCRGPRVCQLRCHFHATVAERRQRPLPVQRLRTVQQDERHQQATDQAKEAHGA
jgi:hypothetical protein